MHGQVLRGKILLKQLGQGRVIWFPIWVSYVFQEKKRYFLYFRQYLNRFVWEPIDPRTKVRVYFFSTGWWFSWRFQQSSGHGRRHMGKITLEETSCWGEIHWAERIRVCLHGSRTLAVEKVIRRLLPSRLQQLVWQEIFYSMSACSLIHR